MTLTQLLITLLKYNADFNESNLTNEEIENFKSRYGKTTRLINVGSIFGERALLTDQPRTATIVADSHPTELIVLDRCKVLPALEELKRAHLLRREILFQIFKDMNNYSSARLESMFYSFSVKYVNRGYIITEQDKKDDKVYIIAEGEAQIFKKIIFEVTNGIQEEKIARLTIIGPGTMVGDEIMLSNEQRYLYTTEIISNSAALLMADRKTIERKFPLDLQVFLKQLSYFKEKGRKVLLENKTEEMKKESLMSLQKETEKKNTISQLMKGRGEEESVDSLRKAKDIFAGKYNTLLVSNSQSDPNVEPDAPGNGILLTPKIKEVQPSGQEPFDLKSLVFDFGDGKNVENAERIEKIFRSKNRTMKELYQTNPTFYQNTSSFFGKNMNQVIKSMKERKLFNCINEWKEQKQQRTNKVMMSEPSFNNVNQVTPSIRVDSAISPFTEFSFGQTKKIENELLQTQVNFSGQNNYRNKSHQNESMVSAKVSDTPKTRSNINSPLSWHISTAEKKYIQERSLTRRNFPETARIYNDSTCNSERRLPDQNLIAGQKSSQRDIPTNILQTHSQKYRKIQTSSQASNQIIKKLLNKKMALQNASPVSHRTCDSEQVSIQKESTSFGLIPLNHCDATLLCKSDSIKEGTPISPSLARLKFKSEACIPKKRFLKRSNYSLTSFIQQNTKNSHNSSEKPMQDYLSNESLQTQTHNSYLLSPLSVKSKQLKQDDVKTAGNARDQDHFNFLLSPTKKQSLNAQQQNMQVLSPIANERQGILENKAGRINQKINFIHHNFKNLNILHLFVNKKRNMFTQGNSELYSQKNNNLLNEYFNIKSYKKKEQFNINDN